MTQKTIDPAQEIARQIQQAGVINNTIFTVDNRFVYTILCCLSGDVCHYNILGLNEKRANGQDAPSPFMSIA